MLTFFEDMFTHLHSLVEILIAVCQDLLQSLLVKLDHLLLIIEHFILLLLLLRVVVVLGNHLLHLEHSRHSWHSTRLGHTHTYIRVELVLLKSRLILRVWWDASERLGWLKWFTYILAYSWGNSPTAIIAEKILSYTRWRRSRLSRWWWHAREISSKSIILRFRLLLDNRGRWWPILSLITSLELATINLFLRLFFLNLSAILLQLSFLSIVNDVSLLL